MLKRVAILCVFMLSACSGKRVDQGAANPSTGTTPPADVVPAAVDQTKAPLLNGMGTFSWKITTENPTVQRLFDQGMVLSYGFNHAEAARSFRYAAKLDPSCAMCWWGAALVAGPNINAKMEPTDGRLAWEALSKAVQLAPKGTKEEQGYIAALAKRYTEAAPADRGGLDQAYADAICAVAKDRAEDARALVFCAEALMDLHPWDYWDAATGKPRAWTPRILALLESAMTKDPSNPGANHLYLHAVEASNDPGRGTKAAERLATLAPGAGHLVHMPSHIYIRTGRYSDATEANELAIKVDDGYVGQCREQGIYPLAYKPHNWHFLWASATMEGRSKRALEAANQLSKNTPDDKMSCHGLGTLQHYKVTPLYAFVRFGKWDEILATPPMAKDELPYLKAVWTYAQAMAHIFKNDLSAAQKDLAALKVLAGNSALEKVTIWDINTTKAVIDVAVEVVEGELAAKQKHWQLAVAHLEKAAALERALSYNEPQDWYYPVRHSLGAVYLEANQPKDAERVYRADLVVWPNNGYALFGLQKALTAQGRAKDAAAVEATFKEAWKTADFTLTSSRF